MGGKEIIISQVRNDQALSQGSDLTVKTAMNYGLSVDGEVGAQGWQRGRIVGKVTFRDP